MDVPTPPNLRHLRALSAVGRTGSLSAASEQIHMSQPAISHAIRNIETVLGRTLFVRTGRGMRPTAEGERLLFRIDRGLDILLGGILDMRPRIGLTEARTLAGRVTGVQIRALLAIDRHRSFSAAARALGVAQPSVFRPARALEIIAGTALFERSPTAISLTRPADALARAALLMLSEFDQGMQEVAPDDANAAPRIRIGALPLVRSAILPRAIDRIGAADLAIGIIDGPYPELLRALRRGELDLMVGALRDPAPSADVVQESLFEDRLGVFCGPGHPLLASAPPSADDLRSYRWVLPRRGAPSRETFEDTLAGAGARPGRGPIETSSMMMVRGLLQSGRRLTMISRMQVATEVATGMMFELPVVLEDPPRPIGITTRRGWVPTPPQSEFLEALRAETLPLRR